MDKKPLARLSPFQSIILLFAAVILAGGVLLSLPISSQSRQFTPFNEALFTATSAVCVTGLVVRDTASHWSAFGQGVILALIQIGGLGVVTVAASFALVSGRRISLMQRGTMQEAMAAPQVGGVVRLTGFILRSVFAVEALFRFLDRIAHLHVPVVAGIWPLASLRNAEFMRTEVPGVVVPDSVMERMSVAADREAQRRAGIEIARESFAAIRERVQGVQVSAPFGNVDTALAVLR